jgi:predicted PurR-regulated permease PerM
MTIERDRNITRLAPAGLLRAGLVCASALLIAAVVILTTRLLGQLAPVTLAVVAALLLAALLMSAVDFLTRLRVPRGLAALIGVLGLLAVLIGPVVLVGQQAATQFGDLGSRLDEGITRVRDWLINGPLPITDQQLNQLWQQTRDAARSALPGPAAGATLAIEALGAALLTLVLLFFLLKDGHHMWAWLLNRLPARWRHRADGAASAGWHALSGYVRGTVIVATVDAIGIGTALLIVGVPLALPLTLLTFVSAFVPIIGATVAGAAAVLVALVANGPTEALIILAAVIAVQQTEGNLLEPIVMGRAVRLHPAVILVAVSAGTVLAGVAGAIIAVPVVAVAYRVITTLTRDETRDETSHGPEAEDAHPDRRVDSHEALRGNDPMTVKTTPDRRPAQ